MVTLSSVAEILNGDRSANYPSGNDFVSFGFPFINAGHLKNGKIDFSTMDYISEDKYRQLSGAKIRKNDILLCLRGSLGKYAVSNINEGAPASSIAVIRPNERVINSKFLTCVISSFIFQKQIDLANNGSSQPNLSASSVSDFLIPIPSLDEQELIAEALSDVDSMISSLEKLIAKKKVIKQGTMQELLTGKKRLAGFDDNWETLSLAEIGAITGSGVDKKILPDEQPITLLNYTNVYHQVSISRKDLNHQVTASAEKIKNCSILRGDVFLTPTSETPEEIAISAVASEDMLDVVYSYHVVRLRPNTCYNGAFINYALSTPMFREQAVQFAEGSGIRYVITLKKFKEMQLYIPTDKAEQDAIVSILSDMDNEIDSLEQKLAKTRQIKHGMMQQLLTGKIRLV